MTIIDGDLLKIESGIILHQVNCMGVTGGLAGALSKKWPDAFVIYHAICESKTKFRLAGECVVGTNVEGPSIAHIFGQINPGPNTELEFVDAALFQFQSWHKKPDTEIYAPYMMGCGLGGGDWAEYKKLLQKHIPDITIVRKYE